MEQHWGPDSDACHPNQNEGNESQDWDSDADGQHEIYVTLNSQHVFVTKIPSLGEVNIFTTTKFKNSRYTIGNINFGT
jgi:hypothetical protein